MMLSTDTDKPEQGIDVAVASKVEPAEADTPRSAVITIAALVFIGAITGAIATFAILGLGALLDQLGNTEAQQATEMMGSIFRRFAGVLGVWIQAPVDGAIVGAITGGAVSIAYLITIVIDRSGSLFLERKWSLMLVLAAAGAIGAAAGSRGVLTDVRIWAALGGALYGFVAAFVIAHSRTEAQ